MIPLHVHTQRGSIGDSTLKITPYIEKAKELNIEALSITNHGSVSDMFEFYTTCKNNNINPIIGCEVYECNNRLIKDKKLLENRYYHLVLIAINNTGLKNILNICAEAETNGKYYKPRTDIETMSKYGKGIIALTACVGGRIPKYLLDNKYNEAIQYLNDLKAIFEDVYLEIQPGMFEEQLIVNKNLLKMSKETNTKLILTNDIHYLNKEDYELHDSHVKSNRKQSKDSPMIYPDKCYYLMNRTDITELILKQNIFNDIEINNMIENTYLIANQVNIELDTSIKMPKVNHTKYSSRELIESICLEQLDILKYSIENPSQYITRMYEELEVIDTLGFSEYFLLVRDLVLYAKNNNIKVGPGRGSVCGSITAYLLSIVDVDPIKYDLLFERFLSVHRIGSLPDIDLDFESEQRQKMFDYSIEKYGSEHCAQVATVSMRKAKAAIRDAAKIYNIDLELEDTIAKLIPQVYYDDEDGDKLTDLSIEQSIEIVPELKSCYELYPDWINTAMELEGLAKASSIHAAGTLISSVKLQDYIPIINQEDKLINATSLDLAQAELGGFIKLDYLGLRTLDVIKNLENTTGFVFNPDIHDLDDKEVWNLIGSKHTTGLFQIASKTYKDRMYRLKPTTIEQLAACLALVRGPCISAKTDQIYMEILEGKREIEKIHPLYDEVTEHTNGILIYQEDLMKLCVNFGFTLEEGYDIMKLSSKKKFDKLRLYEEQFMSYCLNNNIDTEVAERIFKLIIDSGLYSFNKSHAVAYALLCYITAYYKYHYPLHFYAAELTNIYNNKSKNDDKLNETIQDCQRYGIKFSNIDINNSNWEFTVKDNVIELGFCCIPCFGKKVFNELLVLRENYDNITLQTIIDNIPAKVCGKRSLTPLILTGLFGDRTTVYEAFIESRKEELNPTISIHNHLKIDIYDEDSEIERLLLGYAYTTNPVNDFDKVHFQKYKPNTTLKIKAFISRIRKKKLKSNKKFAILICNTADGIIETLVYENEFNSILPRIKEHNIYELTIRKKDNNTAILMQDIEV